MKQIISKNCFRQNLSLAWKSNVALISDI